MNTQVLTKRQIEQKINRIAYEIVENNYDAPVLFLVGIVGNGAVLAKKLVNILTGITNQTIEYAEITVNKKDPWSEEAQLSRELSDLKDGTVILVDDVINSGKTMQYALGELLKERTYQIKTVALVDRKHRRYPIRCDYVGLTLSTTLQDRVEVDLTNDVSAYLV